MLRLPTINYNGGHRKYYDVEAKVNEITYERHWKNLWIKKTMKINLEVLSIPANSFENNIGEKINFSKQIIIHDFDKSFSDLTTEETLCVRIGYADSDQQYWHRVNAFSISILKNEKVFQLI
jgi:hypothetical protein